MLAQCGEQLQRGLDAAELAELMGAARHNVSADLNELWREGLVVKLNGRPVLFWDREVYARLGGSGGAVSAPASAPAPGDPFADLIGAQESLRSQVEQAKAAVLYPPDGLHTLLVGPTGVGKSLMAEHMHAFGLASGRLPKGAPLVTLNCADYAANPQLLMAHLFGSVKGAYTGAEKDREGLIDQANGGILFLDEVHRLPAEGQEMLFRLIDKGLYRRLGESGAERSARVMLIAATTEKVDSALLRTFTRRIPMVITLPALAERTAAERFRFTRRFLRAESAKIGCDIVVPQETLRMLLEYDVLGNIGQLRNDIQLACARLFLSYLTQKREPMELAPVHLPEHIHRTVPPARHRSLEVSDMLHAMGGRLLITKRPPGSAAAAAEADADAESRPVSFYSLIERQMAELQRQGRSLTEAEQIVRENISGYFKDFVDQVRHRHQSQRLELSKLVGPDVLRAVERALLWAEERLGRALPERILYALALHIHASAERVRDGRTQDYQLDLPADDTPESAAAGTVISLIGRELGCALPSSDAAFTTMLLKPEAPSQAQEQVGVVALAHGRVASAMADVAHALTGVNLVVAIDMPLDEEPAGVQAQITQMAAEGRFPGGLLLMVDMGSLEAMGEAVSQQTGLPVRTVSMLSTSLLVEAVHQASMPGATLDQVYHAVLTGRASLLDREAGQGLASVVLTFCFTGVGSAHALARIVREAVGSQAHKIEVIPASIGSGAGWNRLVATLLRSHRLLAAVGPFHPRIPGVPYISTEEIVVGQGARRLRQLVDEGTGAAPGEYGPGARASGGAGPGAEAQAAGAQAAAALAPAEPDASSVFAHLATSLGEHLKVTNPAATVPVVLKVLRSIEQYLGRPLEDALRLGLAMHLVCLLDRKVLERLREEERTPAPAAPHHGALPWLPAALQEVTAMFHIQLDAEELERLDEILTQSV
ncbi:MAG: transcriptional antiterminator [Symbiobacteriaceae bacterium]|jgi:transcriptional regulator with AAA-type ATPase domain/transcriptional regulatory protein LevR|nr:transcriptional antiterminator [Symbiobacteriaceae bacterium]